MATRFEVIMNSLEKFTILLFLEVMIMNTIDEVRNIERQAEELEISFQQKISEMEKDADSKVHGMKQDIDKDINDYHEEQLENNRKNLIVIKEKLDQETIQEIDSIKKQYSSNKDKLVNIVIEEVMKQYGNS